MCIGHTLTSVIPKSKNVSLAFRKKTFLLKFPSCVSLSKRLVFWYIDYPLKNLPPKGAWRMVSKKDLLGFITMQAVNDSVGLILLLPLILNSPPTPYTKSSFTASECPES